MSDNKIDLIDIDDDKTPIEKISNNVNVNNQGGNMQGKKRKKIRLKKGIIQTVFCVISFIFILGCCIYYGNRLIKYYKIYNPKTESGESIQLISTAIMMDTPIVFEGSGMYRESGLSVYKGADANNYIKYSNMLWRIVRSNADGSLDIILDDPINALAWDFTANDYVKSDIHKYINDVFLSKLDKSYLSKTMICADQMASIDKFSCEIKNTDSYVKLLAANDFLNSVADGTTFVSSDDELVWLGTGGTDKVWHTNGSNISSSVNTSTYFVKPVVTIKNSTPLLGGNGSKEDPFVIEKKDNNIKIGSYITIDNDTWIVYDINKGKLNLVYSDLYNKGNSTYRFDTSTNEYSPENNNSLAKRLNTTFYESLSYKDMLLEFDIYTGDYTTSYKDVYKEKVKAKVGILNVSDLKFDSEVVGYYLSTKAEDNKIYYYRDGLVISKLGLSRAYRPTICIKTPKTNKGTGTSEDPFIVEVSKDEDKES